MSEPPSAANIFGNPILRRYWRSRLRPVWLGTAGAGVGAGVVSVME